MFVRCYPKCYRQFPATSLADIRRIRPPTMYCKVPVQPSECAMIRTLVDTLPGLELASISSKTAHGVMGDNRVATLVVHSLNERISRYTVLHLVANHTLYLPPPWPSRFEQIRVSVAGTSCLISVPSICGALTSSVNCLSRGALAWSRRR